MFKAFGARGFGPTGQAPPFPIPFQGKLFKSVDLTWRDSMAETAEEPACLIVARRPGLLDSLIDAKAKLDTIQKGLNDYLRTKMLAFPRFFFLSNDELLEILAETKDPTRVQVCSATG